MVVGQDGGNRTGIDDAAKFAGQHEADRIPRQPETGRQIDVDDPVKVVVLPFHQRPAVLDAGVVHQNIKTAMARRRWRRALGPDLGIGHIEGHRSRPQSFGGLAKGCRIARVDDDVGAILCQRLGHGKAQAARRTGHQGNAILEGKYIQSC